MNKTETIIQWFRDNYIEDNDTIDRLLDETCVKTACSFESLLTSCRKLRSLRPERVLLSEECKVFGTLANYGYTGVTAANMYDSYLSMVKWFTSSEAWQNEIEKCAKEIGKTKMTPEESIRVTKILGK